MLLASLLGHAREVLGLVRQSSKPADQVLDKFFRSRKYLGARDRRFIAETVYGTLRHFRWCEQIVLQSLGDKAASVGKEDGWMLLTAAYQLAIEKNPALDAKLLKEVLTVRLTPEMMDAFLAAAREQQVTLPEAETARLAIQYSFPDWMVERIRRQFGEQTEAILMALNQPAPLTLRVNTLKTTVEECREKLKQEDVEAFPCSYSPFGLSIRKRINMFSLTAFREGLFEVQDEGSQLLPLLIDPKPTARLLDACAGAGGKTLMFSALMKNRGEITAADVHDKRLDELRKRSRRAGAFNIRTRVVSSLDDLAETEQAAFDIVFVDAPCSGLGTIRRNPGMKWDVTPETVEELSKKQRGILEASSRLVRPGGLLAYATCTFLEEENEQVIDAFLNRHPGARVIDVRERLEKVGIALEQTGPYLKLLPHATAMDGFFAAFIAMEQV